MTGGEPMVGFVIAGTPVWPKFGKIRPGGWFPSGMPVFPGAIVGVPVDPKKSGNLGR